MSTAGLKKIGLKKNDHVLTLSGRDSGKKGKILKIYPKSHRAVVEGINMVSEHQRPTQTSPKGGIIRREGTIHLSNIQLVCPRCSKPTRIQHSVLADGSKKRTCKKCKEII